MGRLFICRVVEESFPFTTDVRGFDGGGLVCSCSQGVAAASAEGAMGEEAGRGARERGGV